MDVINLSERPELSRPILIAGFDGWPNAGNISIETLFYLKRMLGAKKFAEIDPDPFHKYTNLRPYAKLEEGEVKHLVFSPDEFFYKKGKESPDLILFIGKEPELRWKHFIQSFLRFAIDLNVEILLTIGGTYDNITHRQEPVISGVFNDDSLKISLANAGIQFIEYEGPISIHTMLLIEARKMGIKGVSLWGHAPQYLQSNNLSVIYQILIHLNEFIGFGLDLSSLEVKAIELKKQIDLIVQKNPELLRIIEKYEKEPESKKETSPEDKIINIVDFLKKNHHED